MKRIIKGSGAWPLADHLLGEWLGERVEVGLSEAMVALDRAATDIARSSASVRDEGAVDYAEQIVDCLAGTAGGDAVSRLLRARGFRKVGMKGSALTYDRQPLYRKVAETGPSARPAEQSEARGGTMPA